LILEPVLDLGSPKAECGVDSITIRLASDVSLHRLADFRDTRASTSTSHGVETADILLGQIDPGSHDNPISYIDVAG
jgi:hypothetical protein